MMRLRQIITHDLSDEITVETVRLDDDDGPLMQLRITDRNAEINLCIRDPQQARALKHELGTIELLLDAEQAAGPLERRSGEERRAVRRETAAPWRGMVYGLEPPHPGRRKEDKE